MSPSKKANKEKPNNKTTSAQKIKNTSARSSHVTTKKAQPIQSEFQNAGVVYEKQSEPKRGSAIRTNLLRVASLIAVIGITYYTYSIRENIAEFEQYGYAGIFLITLMANATVLLPAPGVAVVYAMGGVFNPLWVAVFAALGGTIGELTGYLAGFSGQAVTERVDIFNRIKPWVDKYGGWAIMVLSAIPNPFFDIAGIAAGMAKMPIRSFLIFTWLGQMIKMTIFALAGYYSLEWMENFTR